MFGTWSDFFLEKPVWPMDVITMQSGIVRTPMQIQEESTGCRGYVLICDCLVASICKNDHQALFNETLYTKLTFPLVRWRNLRGTTSELDDPQLKISFFCSAVTDFLRKLRVSKTPGAIPSVYQGPGQHVLQLQETSQCRGRDSMGFRWKVRWTFKPSEVHFGKMNLGSCFPVNHLQHWRYLLEPAVL